MDDSDTDTYISLQKEKWKNLLIYLLIVPFLTLTNLWAVAALWIDVSPVISILYLVCLFAVLKYLRPWSQAGIVYLVLFSYVLLYWKYIPPQAERNWQKDVAEVTRIEQKENTITVYNLRNFQYQSEQEYIPSWEKRSYDLNKLRSLDMFLIYWGDPNIAHTIFSWGFEGGKYLSISIETRKEVGETYSALRGFFRQYELCYVVADERDVIGLRTHHRGEQVYLYRLNAPLERSEGLLLAYIDQINSLAEKPQWYNALSDNCTTMIYYHSKMAGSELSWNWRILVNGYLDEYLYEEGIISGGESFSEWKKKSLISEKAQSYGPPGEDFSIKIREGLFD